MMAKPHHDRRHCGGPERNDHPLAHRHRALKARGTQVGTGTTGSPRHNDIGIEWRDSPSRFLVGSTHMRRHAAF